MTRWFGPTWLGRGIVGIVLATFFSDVAHEMATATLPLYLQTIGFGAAALGVMEGFADLLFSLSKLVGGWVGHHTEHKRRWGSLGYLVTALGTASLALMQTFTGLLAARSIAWLGRGFRAPLRDCMLADEVGPTHFGRAYGVERAADMLGAVAGPLLAALLIAFGVGVSSIILLTLVPALVAVLSFFSLTRDRPVADDAPTTSASLRLPRRFWLYLTGVTLFGLGDFSRTFLILLAAATFAHGTGSTPSTLSVPVLLYAVHNAISAAAAYPAGRLGDRGSKLRVLAGGYALGVVTNILLAFSSGAPALLVLAIMCSGVYLATEETLEKAVAAEILLREQRSLGFGVLAAANAVGDMASSVTVGLLLSAGHTVLAFLLPAGMGLLGTLWMVHLGRSEAPMLEPARSA
ncbi:MAG: MFS transporter [bacterium]|nr:MFS transporter [bacterium]